VAAMLHDKFKIAGTYQYNGIDFFPEGFLNISVYGIPIKRNIINRSLEIAVAAFDYFIQSVKRNGITDISGIEFFYGDPAFLGEPFKDRICHAQGSPGYLRQFPLLKWCFMGA
jgi:hypothetical protein